MKVTIKEAMRLGKEMSNLYVSAVYGLTSAPLHETKEIHEVKVDGILNKKEIPQPEESSSFEDFLGAIDKVFNMKTEIETKISAFNSAHNISKMVQEIKHLQNVNDRFAQLLNRTKIIPESVKYDGDVTITITESAPVDIDPETGEESS